MSGPGPQVPLPPGSLCVACHTVTTLRAGPLFATCGPEGSGSSFPVWGQGCPFQHRRECCRGPPKSALG